MKSRIDAAERAVIRCQAQHLNADARYNRAKEDLEVSERSGIRIREEKAKLNNAKDFLGLALERLEKAREELALLNAQAIEEEDAGEMGDSGDEWSDVAVNTSGGEVARARSVSADFRDDEGVEEENLEDSSDPDGDSKEEKEDDNLFLEDDESTENQGVNAGFQGEFILVIPAKLDDPIFIVDERQKDNESKVEMEMMFLEERYAKILYEDSPYNALLLEHVLNMPMSVNLFDNIHYEGILLQA